MKMVKSLLLGSAAGVVAVVGAQAADLPVKAKPIEYVKVCTLYGEGFFYIPGTDTCLKLGGWVRVESVFNGGGSHSEYLSGSGGRNNRIDTIDMTWRARFVTSFDVRTQSEYGTVRAYVRAGFELTTNFTSQGSFYTERAFIQFAGFTIGKTQSYFDGWNGVYSYGSGYAGGGGSSTGAAGNLVFAYTHQFGQGWSATLSLENPTIRRNAIWDAGTNALAIGALPGPGGYAFTGYATCGLTLVTPDANFNIENQAGAPAIVGTGVTGCPTGDYAAVQIPDIVLNLRVDQAWGSAQIAGALHQVRAGFYGNNVTNNAALQMIGPGGYTGIAPSDKWGFAVMGAVNLNVPFFDPADKLWIEVTYSQGAPCYNGVCQDGLFGFAQRFGGGGLAPAVPGGATGGVAAAWALDAIFANLIGPVTGTNAGLVGAPSGLQLTTVWTLGAAFEHYWTPSLRTSWFGVYSHFDFNGAATAIFCSSPVGPVRTFAGAAPNFLTGAVLGCNPDFTWWGVGSRTIWNPVRGLDIGVEVMYSKVDQQMAPANAALATGVLLNFGGSGGRPAGLYLPKDQDIWSGVVRVQRNFYP